MTNAAMPRIDMFATGNNIKQMIRKNHMRIEDVQDIFGFHTPQAIYKWMRGAAMPTIDNLIVLADIFQVKIDDIIVRF